MPGLRHLFRFTRRSRRHKSRETRRSLFHSARYSSPRIFWNKHRALFRGKDAALRRDLISRGDLESEFVWGKRAASPPRGDGSFPGGPFSPSSQLHLPRRLSLSRLAFELAMKRCEGTDIFSRPTEFRNYSRRLSRLRNTLSLSRLICTRRLLNFSNPPPEFPP